MDLRAELRRSFVAGLLLVAPLAVTLLVAKIALSYLAGVLDPVVSATRLANYTANIHLFAQVLAAILLAATVILLGFVAQRSLGKRFFGWVDRLVGLVPLVSTVYTGVRQVATALTARGSSFERVVLVEYPQTSVYAIGFITGESPAELTAVVGEPASNVFVPNSPNPTAGKLFVVPDDRIHETDLSVRRGLRLVVTTGVAETEDELEQYQAEAAPETAP